MAHVAFSHDEKLLLTISTHHDNGGKVIAWDLSSGLIVASTKRPGFYVSTGAQRPHHTMQRINDTQLLLSDDSIQVKKRPAPLPVRRARTHVKSKCRYLVHPERWTSLLTSSLARTLGVVRGHVDTYRGCCGRRCLPPCASSRSTDSFLFSRAECRTHNHYRLSHRFSQHVTFLVPKRVAFSGAQRSATPTTKTKTEDAILVGARPRRETYPTRRCAFRPS